MSILLCTPDITKHVCPTGTVKYAPQVVLCNGKGCGMPTKTKPVTERQLLTVGQVADILNTAKTTINRMVVDGRLSAIDITPAGSRSPRYRIDSTVLEKFLDERQGASA